MKMTLLSQPEAEGIGQSRQREQTAKGMGVTTAHFSK